MIRAVFAGGPLDGQEVELPAGPLEIDVSNPHVEGKRVVVVPFSEGNVIASFGDVRSMIGPSDEKPRTRYVLGRVDKHGVRHYYIPTS